MFQTSEYEIIPLSFYEGEDVVEISKSLIGKYIFHESEEGLTGGRIVETEAYSGTNDKACHAHKGKTNRNAVMFENGGRAYIYLCYGIHHLFNIVTNRQGNADAVLIRALEPICGVDIMRRRTNKKETDKRLASGPGLVGKAMGFNVGLSGETLGDTIWVGKKKEELPEIVATSRIGVDYAGDDAFLPWRFYEANSDYVSKK